MGIRYYAYPLASKFTELAQIDPGPLISEDPFADFWFTAEEDRPEMLYLDKAWRWLQALTGPRVGPARVAHQLFEGDVTPMDGGYTWLPWIKALIPEQVFAVAHDVARLDGSAVEAVITRSGLPADEWDRECGYVTQFLKAAQEFTARLADRGSGLIYMIG